MNLLDKIEQFQDDHYVMSDNSFLEIKKYEKKLIKLLKIDKLDENLIYTILENLNSNFINQIELTKTIITKLETLIIGEKQNIIEDPFDDNDNIEFNNYTFPGSNKKQQTISFSQVDETSLFNSKRLFVKNYNFNLVLQY
jgi:hypothetical protein